MLTSTVPFLFGKEVMIKQISNLGELPYKTYMAVLLKDESRIEKAEKLEFDGYILVTKHPKMVILFLERNETGTKIGKEIWNLI
jgi:hypothetical protein